LASGPNLGAGARGARTCAKGSVPSGLVGLDASNSPCGDLSAAMELARDLGAQIAGQKSEMVTDYRSRLIAQGADPDLLDLYAATLETRVIENALAATRERIREAVSRFRESEHPRP